MFRKLLSAIAVLAGLSLLTAGAAQARPLAAGPAPGFFQELWRWVAYGGSEILEKEGPGMDPNGHQIYTPPSSPRPSEGGADRERAAGRAG